METMKSKLKLKSVAEPSAFTIEEPLLGEDEAEYHPPSPFPEYHPPSKPTFRRYNYREYLHECIELAIAHYELNQCDKLELLDPLVMTSFVPSDWRIGHIFHVSFIARKLGSSQVKLFFAEIGETGRGRHVKICSSVDPGNPFVDTGCGYCHPSGVIYHPFVEYDWTGGRPEGYSRQLSIYEACAKQLLREAYTIKSTVEDLHFEDEYELKKAINGHALMALEDFSSKNSTYEFLEVVSCTRFGCEDVKFGGAFWAHLIFQAKLKDPMIENSSVVQFFAEVCVDIDLVTSCVTVPSSDCSVSVSGNESRCVVCRDVCPMYHPVGEYDAGYYGGTYADSLYKGNFRAVKSQLLQKDDEAGRTARDEHYKSLGIEGQCAGAVV